MNKEVWLLAVLVGIAVFLNSAFIVIIQTSDSENAVSNSIGQTIIGTDYISPLFSEKTLNTYTSKVKPAPEPVSQPAVSENIKVVKGENGFEMIINYDKKTITIDGRETSIIIDGPEIFGYPSKSDSISQIEENIKKFDSTKGWTGPLPDYERFDLYVDTDYYSNNQATLDFFFNKFEERYLYMEGLTQWSSEQFNGANKLKIYVTSSSTCSSGVSMSGIATVYLYEDISNLEVCKQGYYENGELLYNNPGELGDHYAYVGTMLHEALHAINPPAGSYVPWITEGFSTYFQYNVLVNFGDINQETADTFIANGYPFWNWPDYSSQSFDYHDGCIVDNHFCVDSSGRQIFMNADIQHSRGYYITSKMFQMMRDDYGFNWGNFFDKINDNKETMQKSWELGYSSNYYPDTFFVDVFGKNVGWDFATTQSIWEYDGPLGPGWGVRYWESRDWYADLTPTISFSKNNPAPEEIITINSIVYNNGEVNLENVAVRFYSGTDLIDEKIIFVPQGSVPVSTTYSAPEGTYQIKVVVDEDDLKLETNNNNNEASDTISFSYSYICGDINFDGGLSIGDLTYLITYLFRGGPAPQKPELANVNGLNGINVADLTYLINFFFRDGPDPICNGSYSIPSVPSYTEEEKNDFFEYYNSYI